MDIPVNIKFCFEGMSFFCSQLNQLFVYILTIYFLIGMEESGSEGLDELLYSRKETEFMQNVDYVCISDNYWLGKNKPCITYGLRGICYFFIEVSNYLVIISVNNQNVFSPAPNSMSQDVAYRGISSLFTFHTDFFP